MKEFRCRQCGSCFTRQEHLTRHAHTHTKEKPHACFECGKSFSRSDALRRHCASHTAAPRVTGAFSRACKECAASRARCTREQPCQRCSDKAIACEYPPARRRSVASRAFSTTDFPEASDIPGGVVNGSNLGGAGLLFGPDTGLSRNEPIAQTPGYWDAPNEFFQVHQIESAACRAEYASIMSTMNWMTPANPAEMDWEAFHTEIPMGDPDDQLGLSSTQRRESVNRSNDRTTNATLNEQLWPRAPGGSGLPSSVVESSTFTSQPSESPSSRVGSVSSTLPVEATLYVEGASTRLPFKGRCAENLGTASVIVHAESVVEAETLSETRSPGDDMTSVASKNHLGGVLTGFLSAEAFRNLLRQIRSTLLFEETDVSDSTFPMLGYVRAFLRLYFRRFHCTWPFLPPTLAYYEVPSRWPLLLAVIAVGSRYAPGQQCSTYSKLLCDLLAKFVPRLLDQVQKGLSAEPPDGEETDDARRQDDLAVIQAAILDIVCKSHGDRSSSPKEAFSQMFMVVDTCRDMGLLETSATRDSDQIPPQGLQEWTNNQIILRTGLMIWALDSIIAFEFSRRPFLRLDDASGPLPCCESLWESPSHDLLLTEGKHSSEPFCPRHFKLTDLLIRVLPLCEVTVPKALEIMYVEKGLPSNLDDLGTNILVCAIYRRTREAFQQHQAPLASWVPSADFQQHRQPTSCSTPEETWPPSLPILSKWRNSACDCLDILHWNANGAVAKAGGWEHPAVLNLHLSRLLILTPVYEMQRIAASAPLRRRAHVNDRLNPRGPIYRWALNDQHKARLSVVHASALLWHVRRYRMGSFLEPFAVFLATLVVWSYSSALQLQAKLGQQEDESSSMSPTDTVLDPAFLHLDRPLDDELVQAYVISGHKMAAHISGVGDIRAEEAPAKILNTGIRVLADLKVGERVARNGACGSTVEDEDESVWGIGSVYIQRLERLIRSDRCG